MILRAMCMGRNEPACAGCWSVQANITPTPHFCSRCTPMPSSHRLPICPSGCWDMPNLNRRRVSSLRFAQGQALSDRVILSEAKDLPGQALQSYNSRARVCVVGTRFIASESGDVSTTYTTSQRCDKAAIAHFARVLPALWAALLTDMPHVRLQEIQDHQQATHRLSQK